MARLGLFNLFHVYRKPPRDQYMPGVSAENVERKRYVSTAQPGLHVFQKAHEYDPWILVHEL